VFVLYVVTLTSLRLLSYVSYFATSLGLRLVR